MALLSHRVGWWLSGLVSVFPCVFSSTSANDNLHITYRTETSEVRIAFFATDENDRLVQNVKPNDFEAVNDELVVSDFRSFAGEKEIALEVVVVVVASQSVARTFHRTIESVRLL